LFVHGEECNGGEAWSPLRGLKRDAGVAKKLRPARGDGAGRSCKPG